ncbi:hypothetical protein DRA43_25630, partial [Micromonospora provocatoris]
GDAEAVVAAVAALTAAPGEVPELVTGGIRTAGEAARAVYQPADRVPEDVRQALRDPAPADDNGTVLREHQPAVRRRVVPVAGAQVEVFTAGDGRRCCSPTRSTSARASSRGSSRRWPGGTG